MKISKSQKIKIRKAIINAAVDLMIKKSYKKTTMREIARIAKISDATIYNYFPNKDKIISGYFELAQIKAFESLDSIPNFEEYDLQEKIQSLLESQLEQFLPDREFVAQATDLVFKSPLASFDSIASLRKSYSEKICEFISIEIEKKKIPEQVFQSFICALFWDYYILILLYWLNDDSEMFKNTTQLIDLSLNVCISLLKNGILSKTADLSMFLLKTHILGVTKSDDLFDSFVKFKDDVIGKKRRKKRSSKK